jgi:hypothetical protein
METDHTNITYYKLDIFSKPAIKTNVGVQIYQNFKIILKKLNVLRLLNWSSINIVLKAAGLVGLLA